MKHERNLSIELLRIYSMFFIVWGHVGGYVAQAGISAGSNNVLTQMFGAITGGMGTCAVDLFVLITGYFLVTKTEWNIKRFLSIYIQTVFYLVAITGLFIIFGHASLTDLVKSFFPLAPTKFSYWFVTKYLGLVLLAPFLARLAQSLTKRQYQILVIILLLLNTTFAFGFPFGDLYGGGWTLMWFICLFFCSGYIRLHGNSGIWKKCKIWVCLYFLSVLAWALVSFFNLTQISLSYHSFLTFSVAISLFNIACNIRIKKSKFIHFFAPNTLGVYLIHCHTLIISYLTSTLIFMSDYISVNTLFLLLLSIGIYVISTILDKIRQSIFDIIKLNSIISYIDQKITTCTLHH